MQLEIYRVALGVVGGVAGVARAIGRQDRALADQLRRAACAVPLNIAEGESALGGNRRLRFDTARGSAKECVACLEVAVAMQYVAAADIEASVRGFGRIFATLTKLMRR